MNAENLVSKWELESKLNEALEGHKNLEIENMKLKTDLASALKEKNVLQRKIEETEYLSEESFITRTEQVMSKEDIQGQ